MLSQSRLTQRTVTAVSRRFGVRAPSLTPWKDLKRSFEEIQRQGDWDAHWRFSIEEQPMEHWRLTPTYSGPHIGALEQILQRAGSLLETSQPGSHDQPEATVSPRDTWLTALRRAGINARSNRLTVSVVERGRIDGVIAASLVLCDRILLGIRV